MPASKDKRPRYWDEFDLNDEMFIELFISGLDKLEKEAGDWRDHLPYEVLVGCRRNSEIRKRFRDHFAACAYCQELAETLSPDVKSFR